MIRRDGRVEAEHLGALADQGGTVAEARQPLREQRLDVVAEQRLGEVEPRDERRARRERVVER